VVDFEEGRSLFEKIGFKQEPEEQLHRIVDVTTPQSLHWLIRDKVIAEAEPL
jgi:predicted nucleotidyltransferase